MIWLVCMLMVFGSGFSSTRNVHEMEQDDDKTYGSVVLCDKNAYYVNGTWTPKNMKISGIITGNVDLIFNAGFVSGKLEVEWYIKVKEKDPWILSVGFSQNYKCSTLQQTLESSNLDIIRKPKKCPYKKGDRVTFSFEYETFDDVTSGYNLFHTKLTNSTGHVYVCMNATVYVEAPDDWK